MSGSVSTESEIAKLKIKLSLANLKVKTLTSVVISNTKAINQLAMASTALRLNQHDEFISTLTLINEDIKNALKNIEILQGAPNV